MTDRVSGSVLLVFSIWFGVLAWQLPVSFFGDPVGSRAFPLAVAILLAPLALYLLWRPSPVESHWPGHGIWPSLLVSLAALVAYAWMLEPLGFILATVIAFQVLALVFQAPFWKGLLASAVTTLVLFVLFGRLLGLYLPDGTIFRGWFA